MYFRASPPNVTEYVVIVPEPDLDAVEEAVVAEEPRRTPVLSLTSADAGKAVAKTKVPAKASDTAVLKIRTRIPMCKEKLNGRIVDHNNRM